jgi:hypothetical protein
VDGGDHAWQHHAVGHWNRSRHRSAAVSIGAIGNDAAAQSTVEQTQASPKGGLTNRYETQSSEVDFRLGDHQQLKRILLDGSRDRLR